MSRVSLFALLVCLLLATSATKSPAQAGTKKLALATIEGVVAAVEEREGEGGLPTLAAVLELAEAEETRIVLLAPKASCEEIGFEIEAGDRLRVRIFVAEDTEIAKAHKVLNLTRDTMIRFRTLRSVPLWTASGAWQGGHRQSPQGVRRGSSGRQAPGPGPGGPGSGGGGGRG